MADLRVLSREERSVCSAIRYGFRVERDKLFDRLVDEGLIVQVDDRLRLTPTGLTAWNARSA
jgi:hypothetical protein